VLTRLLSAVLIVLGSGLAMTDSNLLSAADDEVFAPMSSEKARSQTLDWAAGQGLKDRALIDSIGKLWAPGELQKRPTEIHKLAIRTFSLANPAADELVKQCQFGILAAPSSPLLESDANDDFFTSNLLAYVGTFLTQAEFFDEALAIFEKTKPQRLIDPASYFFHKAVCEHRLLKAKEGLATLKQLLENTSDVPVRYSTVADLMKSDLEKLKEKSLDEVARMMSDVERRLKLGRGGAKVQKTEEEIVSRLDELIKKLEQQQQQQSQSQSGNGQGIPEGAPDSIIKGSTAPGEIDERDIGGKAGWGALPPKQQTKARNLIDRELPPHYRNAIEQYLRKLAARPETRSR
jgi:tetratricopeptide (TPR) repeat protein